jgi:1,4-alpha-glucan branching enzyme
VGEALDQAIRELLLLQSSDWNFILKTGTAMGYALARLRAHTTRLLRLCDMVDKQHVDEEDQTWLRDVCSRDNFLAHMEGATLRSPFAQR